MEEHIENLSSDHFKTSKKSVKAFPSNVCSFKFNYFLFENGANETEYLSWFQRAVWIVCKQD